MAQSNLKQPMSQSLNVGYSHLSQTTFLANNCLPPLSPLPTSESSLASSNSNLKDVSMEEIDVSSRGPPVAPFPPPRRGHHGSNSDVPLGFSAMILSSPQLVPISGQGTLERMVNVRGTSGNDKHIGLRRREMNTVSYGKSGAGGYGDVKPEGEVVDDLFNSLINLDHVGTLNSTGADCKDKNSTVCGTKTIGGESSNLESEHMSSREGLKRSATGDIVPTARHYRSLSMDSALGNFHLDDESPKLQASLCHRVDQLSPSNSVNENSAKLNLDYGHCEFNDVELKKIMSDERLAEIAVTDPKRAKRILANRQSAARSKERKLRYISELEHKVQTLQTEATRVSAQVTFLQKEYAELTNRNNELKFRVQAMEKQAQIRDALHEALTAEVQRLKLVKMELRDEGRTCAAGEHVSRAASAT